MYSRNRNAQMPQRRAHQYQQRPASAAVHYQHQPAAAVHYQQPITAPIHRYQQRVQQVRAVAPENTVDTVITAQPQSISHENSAETDPKNLSCLSQTFVDMHDVTKAALLSNTSDSLDNCTSVARSAICSFPIAGMGSAIVLGMQPATLVPSMFCGTFGTVHHACLAVTRVACAPIRMKVLGNPNKETAKSILYGTAKDIAIGAVESIPGVACCVEPILLQAKRSIQNEDIRKQNAATEEHNRTNNLPSETVIRREFSEDIVNPALVCCSCFAQFCKETCKEKSSRERREIEREHHDELQYAINVHMEQERNARRAENPGAFI